MSGYRGMGQTTLVPGNPSTTGTATANWASIPLSDYFSGMPNGYMPSDVVPSSGQTGAPSCGQVMDPTCTSTNCAYQPAQPFYSKSTGQFFCGPTVYAPASAGSTVLPPAANFLLNLGSSTGLLIPIAIVAGLLLLMTVKH
jgi:hypothetical protein